MAARALPDPATPVPPVAWPTLLLFVCALALWGTATTLGISGALPTAVAVGLDMVAVFMFFTVLHEASHRTAGEPDWLNVWLGRVSVAFLSPLLGYRSFRFIHMQHHLHTNADESLDPDHYTSNGPPWSWPLRWATLDLKYGTFYLPKLKARPRAERIEGALTATVIGAACVATIATGGLTDLLVYYILPARIAIFALGYGFDFLPHHGLGAENRFTATRNRIGLEALLTPLLLYQNYHLVHHLHPRIPFYRYISAWRSREDEYLANEPALCTVAGRELTTGDYRRLRGLDA